MKKLSYAISIVLFQIVHIIVLVTTGFFVSSALAQEKIYLPALNPALAALKFYPDRIDLEFSDGRVARLLLGLYAPTHDVQTHLQLQENICFPEILGSGCDWRFDYGHGRIAFRWVANPDASLLNKAVTISAMVSLENGAQSITSTLTIDVNTLSHPFLHDVLGENKLKKPTLTCADDQWVHNFPTGKTQQSYKVPVWTAEFMLANEITGKSENMVLSTLYNTTLNRIADKTYELEISQDYSAEGLAPQVPFFPVQTIYYSNNQKNCSIQMKNAVQGAPVLQPADPEKFESVKPMLFPNGINKAFVRNIFSMGYVIKEQPANVKVTVF